MLERGWAQIFVMGVHKKWFWPEPGLGTGFCQSLEQECGVRELFQNGADGLSCLFVAGIVPETIRTLLEEQSGKRQGLGDGEALVVTEVRFKTQHDGNTLDVIDLGGKSWCGATSTVVSISPWFALGSIQCGIKLGSPKPFGTIFQVQYHAAIRSHAKHELAAIGSVARRIESETMLMGYTLHNPQRRVGSGFARSIMISEKPAWPTVYLMMGAGHRQHGDQLAGGVWRIRRDHIRSACIVLGFLVRLGQFP